MIDEAFLPLHKALLEYASVGNHLQTPDGNIQSYIYRFRVESPVEMDVVRGEDGKLQLGTVPPLYDVETSIRPSLHRMRFTAEWTGWKEEEDSEASLDEWISPKSWRHGDG